MVSALVKEPPALDYDLTAMILVHVEANQESLDAKQDGGLSLHVDFSDITEDTGTYFCDITFGCRRSPSGELSGVEIAATYGIAFHCEAERANDVVRLVSATVAWSKFSDLVGAIDAHMRTRLPPLPLYATK